MVALGGACVVALGGHAWFYSGGACMVLFGGACMVLFGGHAWFYSGGMRGFIWGACVVLFGGMRGFIRGHAWFIQGGHAWFYSRGGMHGFFSFFRYNEIRSMSGRYASYWNAFLSSMCFEKEGEINFPALQPTHISRVRRVGFYA